MVKEVTTSAPAPTQKITTTPAPAHKNTTVTTQEVTTPIQSLEQHLKNQYFKIDKNFVGKWILPVRENFNVNDDSMIINPHVHIEENYLKLILPGSEEEGGENNNYIRPLYASNTVKIRLVNVNNDEDEDYDEDEDNDEIMMKIL